MSEFFVDFHSQHSLKSYDNSFRLSRSRAKNSNPKKPIQLLAILFLSVISFSSCKVTTRIITSTQSADAVNVMRDTTVVHYFWGLKQAADIHPGCDPRFNHLNKVEVKAKPGQMLISVITLGIVIPQTVSWVCAPFNPTPGTLGSPR